MTKLTSLADIPALEAAIAESRQRPVLLFKHSRTCGISCEAYEQLHLHVSQCTADAAYKLITVQSHRRVADEVATRLGIRHESPQAILLRDGSVVWHGSHFRITVDQLKKVVQ
jgi:thioredoxin 1